MKQQKIKLLLLILFTFAIWSCTEDYENEENLHQHNHNYSIKKYTYKQALKLQKFSATNKIAKQSLNLKFGKINLSKKGKNKSLVSKDASSILAIDSTLIKEVSTGETTTYSMLVVLDSVDYSDGSFDNLVVKTDSQDNSEAFIVHYTPTEEITYNAEHDSYNFTGTTETSKVYGIYSFTSTTNEYGIETGGETGGGGNTNMGIICVDILKCNGTRNGGTGPIHNAGPGCTQTFIVRECSSNPNWNPYASGSGSSSETGISDNENNNTGPGGGGLSSGTDYETGENNTTTVMVVPHELYDEENSILDTNPCDSLRSKTSNNSNYMAKFNNLNIEANYTANVEKGFAEKIVNGQSQYIDLTASGNDGLIFPPGCMNFTHVHNNKPSTNSDGENYDAAIKIFSPEDLDCLLGTCQNNADSDLSNAFGVMISNEGIFSISLLEPFVEPADFEIKKKVFRNNYKIASKKIITETDLTPLQRKKALEKMFLKELKTLGLENKVALFEGKVSNLNGINRLNWTRKTLSSNNMTVTETPCNL